MLTAYSALHPAIPASNLPNQILLQSFKTPLLAAFVSSCLIPRLLILNDIQVIQKKSGRLELLESPKTGGPLVNLGSPFYGFFI